MTDQVTYTKFGPKYFVHTDQMSCDNKKDVSVWGAPSELKVLFYCQILNWTFLSVCKKKIGPNLVSVTWSVMYTYCLSWFIIFYTDLLQKFNYVLGFFIQTDPTFNSNSFIKSFQHLTSQKIVLCLQCEGLWSSDRVFCTTNGSGHKHYKINLMV